MLPGMNIGTQAGDPLTVSSFQMQSRHQYLMGRAVLFRIKFMNVPEAQALTRKPRQLVDFGAAQWAGPIVVKRILFHAIDTQQDRPRTCLTNADPFDSLSIRCQPHGRVRSNQLVYPCTDASLRISTSAGPEASSSQLRSEKCP